MFMYKTKNPHRYNKTEEICTISFDDCGYIEVPAGFLYKKRFLDKYEILYVTKGGLYFRLDNREIVLPKNRLIILPPYKTLEGFRQSGQATGFYYVNFTTDNPACFGVHSGAVETDHSPEIVGTLEKLVRQKSDLLLPDFINDALLLTLLGEINRTTASSGRAEIAAKLQQYIEQNIAGSLTADTISGALQYNRDYLCRIVKKQFGVSLRDYIIRCRLDLAKKLLITSDYPVQEIASMVGYSDPNLFTKFFSYHTGQSPQSYRYSNV